MNHFGAFLQKDLAPGAYTCNVPGCGNSYRKVSELRAHKRWHDKEGRYVCEYPDCEMSFKYWNTLSKHTETHTGEKTYEYDICKKISRKYSLKRHRTVHSRKVSFIEGTLWKGIEQFTAER
jgi:hypothetical protein